jgi:hypothetical protein
MRLVSSLSEAEPWHSRSLRSRPGNEDESMPASGGFLLPAAAEGAVELDEVCQLGQAELREDQLAGE